MWSQNPLTERLNLKWPIFQSPMGDITTPSLAAAVSEAGGLGGLGMWGFSGEDAERRVAGFRQQSGGSLNVNYPLWDHPGDISNTGHAMRTAVQKLYDQEGLGPIPNPVGSAGGVTDEHLEMLQKMKPELISFHFGLPGENTIAAIKEIGIFIVSSATTVAEARALEQRGVDAIIAQGIEAGGHRGTFTDTPISMQPGLFSLLPQVVDAVRVPVIAAGGISDGRTIAAAIMMGASAVQIGTAFLRCEEANVSDSHKDGLDLGTEANTVVTPLLSGRPARFIKNKLIDDLTDSDAEPLAFPAQMGLIHGLGGVGKTELTPLYAGQSIAMARNLPAGELVEKLAAETTACFQAYI